MVSLAGQQGDMHPANLDEFMAFARELRTPTIYKAIRNAKPVGDVARYGLRASIRRHYERLARFPRGLLPIADSVCRFNPVFGQGMSVAAQEAGALRRFLEARAALPDPLDGLAPAFFAEIEPLLAAPWSTAETDFVYPQTRGDRPADFAQRMQYAAALTRLAAEDASVHRLVAEVNSLVRPPDVLRDPKLVSRVRALMAAAV
jgi:2-polyprenyl-6-methoxyphenol hydroxylase-like FAD-dependent oxidoreductase